MERGKRKIQQGIVLSDKMDKTVVVRVERRYRHPLYQKVVRANAKFMAHDEENKCGVGDLVEIMETRPLSRNKRWRVIRIIGKGKLTSKELPKKSAKELANLAKTKQELISDTTTNQA